MRCTRARSPKDWEGLIAKDASSTYQAGRRSPAWRKIKVVHEQEFVIGGWTAPRQTRQYFGALLLGVLRVRALEVRRPHRHRIRSERACAGLVAAEGPRDIEIPVLDAAEVQRTGSWVRPDLVAQVKFTEWTDDGKLRHPVYLGLRDDKSPKEVVMEKAGPRIGVTTSRRRQQAPDALGELVKQLQALEDARRDGDLALPNGDRLRVTNLSKVFWPESEDHEGRTDPVLRGGVAVLSCRS